MLKELLKSKFLTFVYFGVVFVFLFLGGMFLSGGVLRLKDVLAQTTSHNVSGYAWSSNFGWVSFSCDNGNTCGTANYGVDIDYETGNFSGYAWSPNIGWIQFNPSSPYPGEPQTPVNYNKTTGVVTGWAKILSLSDNGWLKMDAQIDRNTGNFSGWAWNNSSDGGLGWFSLNGSDAGAGGSYSVHYDKPYPNEPSNVTVEDVLASCGSVRVSWDDNSSNETGFKVEYKDNSSNWLDFCSIESNVKSCTKILSPFTAYSFRVQALGSLYNSEWVEFGPFTTSHCAPDVIEELQNPSCAGATITWTQQGGGVDHYEVWRSKDSGSNFNIIEDNIDSVLASYTDTTVLPGVAYIYRVDAVDGDGNPVSSETTTESTPCPNIPKWREVRPK